MILRTSVLRSFVASAGLSIAFLSAGSRALGQDAPLLQEAAGIRNVLTVGASGAQYTSINAALAETRGASATNRFVIQVAPGKYVGRVVMQPFVELVGAGRNLTTLTAPGAATLEQATTLRTAANSRVSSLTVWNTGGAAAAVGVSTEANGRVEMEDVNVLAVGGTAQTFAINSPGKAQVRLRNVIVQAIGETGVNTALRLGGTAFLDDAELYAPYSGTPLLGYGIDSESTTGGGAVLDRSSVSGPVGIRLAGSNLSTRNSRITGREIGLTCIHCYGYLRQTTTASALTTPSGSNTPVAVEVTDTGRVEVHAGELRAAAGRTATATTGSTLLIAGAYLYGAGPAGVGTIKCANTYNSAFEAFTNTCP